MDGTAVATRIASSISDSTPRARDDKSLRSPGDVVE
jgi:hypothetical protein